MTHQPTAGAGASPARGTPLPRHVEVAVVGAGFGGLGAAIALREAGVDDLVVLDRAPAVGGTWWANTYPGCGCDVPSHVYAFSFAPNPGWSRSFSPQPEIRRYLEDVADRHGLRPVLRLGTEVHDLTWDEEAGHWHLRTSRGDLTARSVVAAAGPLTEPEVPDLPGLAAFDGEVVHTARWPEGLDLTGRRVAVVGTGASVIQLVPAIQPSVGHLTVFMRTPPWVIPKLDRPITRVERALYRRVPAAQRAVRGVLRAGREATVLAFVDRTAVLRMVERVSRWHLERQVKDERLRRVLTPSYRLGCKRILPSNHFYRALDRPGVDVVPSALARVRGRTAVAADGSEHEVDVIVLGTRFRATDPPIARRVVGRDGRTLAQHWAATGMRALRGTTVDRFPNLFLLAGPNTGLGHTSMVLMIEAQLPSVTDAVMALRRPGVHAVEARPEALDRWNAEVQRRMRRTVWSTGGCSSWYQDEHGRITTLWPSSTVRFRRETATLDLSEYEVRRAPVVASAAGSS